MKQDLTRFLSSGFELFSDAPVGTHFEIRLDGFLEKEGIVYLGNIIPKDSCDRPVWLISQKKKRGGVFLVVDKVKNLSNTQVPTKHCDRFICSSMTRRRGSVCHPGNP